MIHPPNKDNDRNTEQLISQEEFDRKLENISFVAQKATEQASDKKTEPTELEAATQRAWDMFNSWNIQ